MKFMVARRYQPLSERPMYEPPRKHLPSHVICHPHHGHDGQQKAEHRDVNSGYLKLEFDFTRLSKGTYIANVKLGNEIVRRKLVIE